MKYFLSALVLTSLLTNVVQADTLYQAAPPSSAAGHPMRLGADHKASQVGDLIQVVFNFSINSSNSQQTSQADSKKYNLSPSTGLAGVSLLRFGAGFNSGNNITTSRSNSDQNSFLSTMEAQVTDVLPSGALRIAGDQFLEINGQKQTLHITGLVRPEDVDNLDSVLSTRVANVQASFTGTLQPKNRGLLQKIVNFLF